MTSPTGQATVTAPGAGSPPPAGGVAAPASGLSLRGVVKILGGRRVVEGLDLDVGPGELVSLLGPSGCGKTTTLRMIGGFLEADEGRILIDGVDVTGVRPARRPTAMVFQQYALWPHMSVYKNVAYGLNLRKLPKDEVDERVQRILDLVGISHLADRYSGHISGGEQQRAALARALVIEPKVLLLDEPLSNLDAKLRVQIREEIKSIQQRLGITTVFVTHDQDEALSVSDRVAVMSGGEISQIADPSTLYREPATTFVAGFVGAVNFIRGTVRDGKVSLELGGRPIPLAGGEGAGGDGDVEVAVRPEDVVLADTDPLVTGTVVREVQRGHFKELVCTVGESRVRLYVANTVSSGGSGVGLRFARARAYRDGVFVGELDPAGQ